MKYCVYRITCYTLTVWLFSLMAWSAILADGPFNGKADKTINWLSEQPTLILNPGESGKIIIDLGDYNLTTEVTTIPNYSIATLEIEAGNVAQSSGVAVNCWGSVTTYGNLNNKLWRWESIQFFNFNGNTVNLESNRGTPTTYYPGWSFDHTSYTSQESGSGLASAISAGYFKYGGGVQRKVGYVTFQLQGNGSCQVEAFSGDW